MGIKKIVYPTDTPITLSEAKNHAYITINDDDDLIEGMIESATELCENYTGTQLSSATFEQSVQEWDNINLLKTPLKTIQSLNYYDEDDNIQTLVFDDYFYIDDYVVPNRIVMKQGAEFPSLSTRVNPIIITFIAGYDNIPNPIKSWLKIQVATFYEHREEFTDFKTNEIGNRYVDRLLDQYKVTYV